MLSSIKERKRKAPTLRAEDWEPYKARIIELHVNRSKPLPEVKTMLERETGFQAGIRQYRLRLSQWGKDKNIKPREMKAIVRKRQQRKVAEQNRASLGFRLRGIEVDPHKVDRWMKEKGILENTLYAPSPVASTPSAVSCWTISERNSPAPSPPCSIPDLPSGSVPPPRNTLLASPTLQARLAGDSHSILSCPEQQDSSPKLHKAYLPPFPLSAGASFIPENEPQNPARYKHAEEYPLRHKLSSLEAKFGVDHPESFSTLMSLGNLYRTQGRFKAAEEIYQRIHQKSQQLFGADHDHTLRMLILLGATYMEQGLYSKSEQVLQESYAKLQILHGPQNRSTINVVFIIGDLRFRQHRYDDALKLLEPLLNAREIIPGSHHFSTMHAAATLSKIYAEQGRLEEAEALAEQILAHRQRAFGLQDIYTLSGEGDLAMIYHKLKRLDEAAKLLDEVLKKCMDVLGPFHPQTLFSMSNLSKVWQTQGKTEQAETLMAKCHRLEKRILGMNHPVTKESATILAQWIKERQSQAYGISCMLHALSSPFF